MTTLRPGLRWTLVVALVASAGVLAWSPKSASTLVEAAGPRGAALAAAGERLNQQVGAGTRSDPAGVHGERLALRLPFELSDRAIRGARVDPFGLGVQAAAVPVTTAAPAPAAPLAQPVTASPPPAPAAPPLGWRLLGTMLSPAGERIVMLVHEDGLRTASAEAGVSLDGGYTIVSVSSDVVRLLYAPTQTEAVIAIPAAPATAN